MKGIYILLAAFILFAFLPFCFGQDIQNQIEYPVVVASQTSISFSTTSKAIPPLAFRRFIQVINLSTGTIYISTATTAFAITDPGLIPIYSLQDWCDILAATVPVGIAGSISSVATVLQGK